MRAFTNSSRRVPRPSPLLPHLPYPGTNVVIQSSHRLRLPSRPAPSGGFLALDTYPARRCQLSGEAEAYGRALQEPIPRYRTGRITPRTLSPLPCKFSPEPPCRLCSCMLGLVRPCLGREHAPRALHPNHPRLLALPHHPAPFPPAPEILSHSLPCLLPLAMQATPHRPVHVSVQTERQAAATFGVTVQGEISPKNYLKKGGSAASPYASPSGSPGKIKISPTKRDMGITKPPVPGKNERPVYGLASQKNYITANAVSLPPIASATTYQCMDMPVIRCRPTVHFCEASHPWAFGCPGQLWADFGAARRWTTSCLYPPDTSTLTWTTFGSQITARFVAPKPGRNGRAPRN